ncbi:MAG: hypothetical protein HFF14_03305 [Angelakisella sp.]|nr:hypothetical protein [Angelakisella sp.]
MLAMALALFAVGCSKKDDSLEQQARLALEELLTCTAQQAEEIDAAMLRMMEEMEAADGEPGMAQGGTALLDHFTGRFGGLMTDDCIQTAIANRDVTRSYDLFQKHQADIKPDPLELSKQEGEKEVYTFSVTLKTPDGKETATATGTITMEETEAGWMAANITLTVKEPYGR